MKKWALGLALFGCVTVVNAAPAQNRVDAIWSAAMSRINTQQDVWFDDGDFPACIQLLKVQAELFPSDYEIWTNLGWMEENVESWDAALATYIRYRRSNPNDPDASLPEATYYNNKKLYTKVIAILEPVLKMQRIHPNNFRLLARAYERQSMFSDASRVLNLMIARFPNDGQAKVNLARVTKKLGSSGG